MSAAVTLCFLTRTGPDGARQVLLGLKKAGFGTGKIVGIGGHLEPKETPEQAIIREVAEECTVGIRAQDLRLAGSVDFIFPARPAWNMHSTIFLCDRWSGDPLETAEIAPQWFDIAQLPAAQMWQDAEHWLPRFLAGERLEVRITLNDDNETVSTTDAREFTLPVAYESGEIG